MSLGESDAGGPGRERVPRRAVPVGLLPKWVCRFPPRHTSPGRRGPARGGPGAFRRSRRMGSQSPVIRRVRGEPEAQSCPLPLAGHSAPPYAPRAEPFGPSASGTTKPYSTATVNLAHVRKH